MPPRRHASTVRRLEQATGRLGTAATTRMEETLPWFRQLTAEQRSWVGLVAQAGIAAFVEWFRHPERIGGVTADIFGTAPRDLVRAITLQQTVEMVRTTIAVVEEDVDSLAGRDDPGVLREALLRYSREVAFAAAEVYARAAESRGAWDARLEALVIDALLRDEMDQAAGSRAAALGWGAGASVLVLAGAAPLGDPGHAMDVLRRSAAHHGLDLLTGVHGETLVAVVGGSLEADRIARLLVPHFGPGPVVISSAATGLAAAGPAAREALAGLRAVAGWPAAPRPVAAADLLPERALTGDVEAADRLAAQVYGTLAATDPVLLETLAVHLERSASLESTARQLFVHPNTVRYRLRRVADITGLHANDPREALALRLGLILGRLRAQQRFVGFLQHLPPDVGRVVSGGTPGLPGG